MIMDSDDPRSLAEIHLERAREAITYPEASEHQMTQALIGIGYALLAISDNQPIQEG